MTSKIKNLALSEGSAHLPEPMPRALQLRLGFARPSLLERLQAAWRGARDGFLTGLALLALGALGLCALEVTRQLVDQWLLTGCLP